MWVSEASVARESSAWGSGCTSGVAVARVALMLLKDCCRGGRPVQHLGITFEALSQWLECVGGRKWQ